jgi:acetyl-CoA carboxylase biotin carboxyl carrier protein
MSDLTPEDVREILRAIDEAGYDEFELETPRFTLRLNRRAEPSEVCNESTQSRGVGGPNPVSDEPTPAQALVDVTSPMVGTLYRSPAPGASPFVAVGSRVEVGAQLCIIEVMKLMNAVTSSTAGTVAEVCVENGAAVQYGDVIFRIRADG